MLFFSRRVSIVSRKKQTRRKAKGQKMADKNDMNSIFYWLMIPSRIMKTKNDMNSIFYKARETGTVMSYEEWVEYCLWGKAVIDSNIKQGVLYRVRQNAAGRWIRAR